LHLDCEPGYRGGQRQLAILVQEQLRDPELAVSCWVRSKRLLAALQDLGVDARPWPSLGRATAMLRTVDVDILHAHDARSHGAARLGGWPRTGRSLVVHRRVDDVPRDRRWTRWKYSMGTFVCVSQAVADVLGRFGVPSIRTLVVPSAVDAGPEQAAPSSPGGALKLVSVGALVPHKGHSVLLHALASCSRPHGLTVCGDGPLRAELEGTVQRLGLGERVVFAGDIGDALDVVRGADLVVHPSITEGLGTAVLDALAAGRPVIASRVGGLPEIVDDSCGRLVPPSDPGALAAALDGFAAFAEESPEAFARMGQVGRSRVLQRHRPRQLSAGVRAVYDGLR
jgi:glycosyltransferase involved in cell wall biosynthesis